jgi:hypothetical protein
MDSFQTFWDGFEPEGSIESKLGQIGNAVPPLLMQRIVSGLITGASLADGGHRLNEKSRIKGGNFQTGRGDDGLD